MVQLILPPSHLFGMLSTFFKHSDIMCVLQATSTVNFDCYNALAFNTFFRPENSPFFSLMSSFTKTKSFENLKWSLVVPRMFTLIIYQWEHTHLNPNCFSSGWQLCIINYSFFPPLEFIRFLLIRISKCELINFLSLIRMQMNC